MNTSSKFKFLLSTLFIAILISSCIPSLHPIYTDATREIDDRLLGTWSNRRIAEMENVSYDVTISSAGDTSIHIRNAEDGPNSGPDLPESLSTMISSLGMTSNATWTFEQASEITYNMNFSATTKSSVTLTPGVRSFAPKGSEIVSEDMLPYYILTHKDLKDGKSTTSYLIVNMTEIGGEMYLDFMPFPKGDKLRQGAFAANYISGHTFAKVNFDNDKLNLEMFDGEYIEKLIKSRKVRLRHESLGVDGDIILTASTKELRAFIKKYGSKPDLFDDSEVLVQL